MSFFPPFLYLIQNQATVIMEEVPHCKMPLQSCLVGGVRFIRSATHEVDYSKKLIISFFHSVRILDSWKTLNFCTCVSKTYEHFWSLEMAPSDSSALNSERSGNISKSSSWPLTSFLDSTSHMSTKSAKYSMYQLTRNPG